MVTSDIVVWDHDEILIRCAAHHDCECALLRVLRLIEVRGGGCEEDVCDVEVVMVECLWCEWLCDEWWECGGDCDEVIMVGDVVGVWGAEVGGIVRCASVVRSDV